MEPLGTKKPSELLALMVKLKPASDKSFMAYHFLQRLPREVRILLAEEDTADMRALAEKADKLAAHHSPQISDSIAAVQNNSSEDDVAAISNKQRGKFFKKRGGKSGFQRGNSNNSGYNGGGGNGGEKRTSLCFYHGKFGNKAFRCEGDCAWPEN